MRNKKHKKKSGISSNISVISISMSGLNAYWMTETVKLGLKNKSLYDACKIHLKQNDRGRLKVKGWK